MRQETASEVPWHRGRPCDGGNCVEIAVAGEEIMLRSTESPAALITLSRGEWRDFLAGAKEGLFDHL